ncbi:MAG: hypothetical protein HXY46_00835 [Syntrophaceae bacterium]|nr:hypothetical protein [Syntrophaceae bacterium]
MVNSKLPAELVSLIHYIELNKTGWWDRAIQQLIIATIWLSGKTLTAQEISEELHNTFFVSFETTKVQSEIEALLQSGILIPLSKGQYKISEQSLREFEKELTEFEEIEREAKKKFAESLKNCCPTLECEGAWRNVNEQLVLPMVQALGARTYELISGDVTELEKVPTFQSFLEQYQLEIRPLLRNAIISFLDPRNPTIRSYILRYLNAYFFLEASNLREDSLKALTKRAGQAVSFEIFVDTNFIFSILGLHENPSNEVALFLLDLIKQLSNKISVKLFVFSPTIDEAIRVLKFYRGYLKDLRLTPNLADVAVKSEISGIARKFAQESRNMGQPMNAEDYFAPYITDLIMILRSKGVEFYDERVDHYKTKQEVIDDIMSQWEYEQRLQRERGATFRAKGYDQIEHDVVLWHFVNDKRSVRVESPLDAQNWVVTVDFRFLGFDAFKKRVLLSRIPVCVHPTALIQMLNFWVPRTVQFEEALVGSLQWPFLFQEFDPKAEKLTIRILGTLSRFENVEELTKETITNILINEALRNKLTGVSDIEKEVELVREALVEENKKVREKLEVAESKVNKTKLVISKLQQQIEKSEKQFAEEHQLRMSLETRIIELESRIETIGQQRELSHRRQMFVIRWFILPAAFIILIGLATSSEILRFVSGKVGFWEATIGIWSLFSIIWLWLLARIGSKDSGIKLWQPFIFLHKFKNWAFAVLGALTLKVLASAIWDWIKHVFY